MSPHRAKAFCRIMCLNTTLNADEVDRDMHERLMRAVEDGDIEVIDMWEEGDGLQDNTLSSAILSDNL